MIKLGLMSILIIVLVSCELVKPEETSQDKPHELNLTREQQRTLRYDCDGKLISDKVETLNSLSKTYSVKPKLKGNLYGFKARGVESGDTAGGLAIIGKRGKFTVDYAPTVFNIQIYKGLNEIRYNFEYCDISGNDENGHHVCLEGYKEGPERSFWLNLNYSVQTLPETREVRPSQESCESES